MPYFQRRVMPIMEQSAQITEETSNKDGEEFPSQMSSSRTPERIRVKNRRKRYLDLHPEYFDSSLELADPLMYDRLIRRFQTPAEREAEGRAKGYSGVLEADLMRSEAKLAALAHPDPNTSFSHRRGPDGEIVMEEEGDVPENKEDGMRRWRYEMQMRFLRGDDVDFEYDTVDKSEKYDDLTEEEREAQDEYFGKEPPIFVLEGGREPEGETGVQDF